MTFATVPTRCFAFMGIALLALLGCKDSAVKQDAIVQGTVTIDGELLERGIVTFHPDGGGPVAYGSIHKDGTYALRIGQGQRNDPDNSKIYPGKYTATVAATVPSRLTQDDSENLREPGPRLTDARFSDKTTSELKYEVVSGRNVINISVERARPEEPKEDTEEGAESEESATTGEDQSSPIEQETRGTENSPQELPQSGDETDSDTAMEEPAE